MGARNEEQMKEKEKTVKWKENKEREKIHTPTS
jgi:hypothetical protein